MFQRIWSPFWFIEDIISRSEKSKLKKKTADGQCNAFDTMNVPGLKEAAKGFVVRARRPKQWSIYRLWKGNICQVMKVEELYVKLRHKPS